MTFRLLTNSDQEIIRSFLGTELLNNLYLLDLLDRQGVDFWGFCRWTAVFEETNIIALNVDISCLLPNHPCKLSVPVGHPTACEILGSHTKKCGGTERISSERDASDGFYRGLGEPEHRILQDQRLFYSDVLLSDNALSLQPATLEDFDVLFEYTAHMRFEDEGYDPRDRDEDLWRKTVQALLIQKRILVHKIDNAISFVIEIGTRCSIGCQIGSTYVPPHFRRRGLGYRGMRGSVEYLLPDYNCISLLAHEQNIPAIACHRRAGLLEGDPFRLIEMKL